MTYSYTSELRRRNRKAMVKELIGDVKSASSDKDYVRLSRARDNLYRMLTVFMELPL